MKMEMADIAEVVKQRFPFPAWDPALYAEPHAKGRTWTAREKEILLRSADKTAEEVMRELEDVTGIYRQPAAIARRLEGTDLLGDGRLKKLCIILGRMANQISADKKKYLKAEEDRINSGDWPEMISAVHTWTMVDTKSWLTAFDYLLHRPTGLRVYSSRQIREMVGIKRNGRATRFSSLSPQPPSPQPPSPQPPSPQPPSPQPPSPQPVVQTLLPLTLTAIAKKTPKGVLEEAFRRGEISFDDLLSAGMALERK